MRITSPRQALDYPHLPDDAWVIWHGNAHSWPDARRQTSYLSKYRRDIMKNWALFTMEPGNAAVFADEPAARHFLAEQEALRGQPYHGVRISTVAALKRERGYAAEASPNTA